MKSAYEVFQTMQNIFPNRHMTKFAESFYCDSVFSSDRKNSKPMNISKLQNSNSAKLPEDFVLQGNYPNPFNPETKIRYALPCNSDVEMIIYDIMGKEIKRFNIGNQTAGYQEFCWNGTNESGNKVSSGIYIYRFYAQAVGIASKYYEKTSKMLLIK